MQNLVLLKEAFKLALVAEARSHIGEYETKPNRSDFIDAANRFTLAPLGSPYCLSAILYCAHELAERMAYDVRIPRICSAVKFYTQSELKSPLPEIGSIMIWQRLDDEKKGHAALVTGLLSNGMIETIEFNTSNSAAGINRDGDGCFAKIRSPHGTQNMRVMGWVRLV
jgi:hypothetical protein